MRKTSVDKRNRSYRVCLIARAAVIGLMWSALAHAQGRMVIVNGEVLDANGLAVVDTLNCGTPVLDGIYWLDLDSRTWGVPGQGNVEPLPDCSGTSQQQTPAEESGDCESRYSMWEDRMMYCYGVNPNP
jgi:hypothetical protein